MVVCEICKREFKDLKGLTSHIKVHKISSKEYYDKYMKKDINEGKCLECGKDTTYANVILGYNKYCSYKCSANSKETREKCKNTCLDRYDVINVSQAEGFNKKFRQTCLKKYGVKNPSQYDKFKEKKKQSYLFKYDHEYFIQTKEFQEKCKKTCLQKYGKEHASQSEEVKEKYRKTCLKKYGTENPNQCKEIREKTKKTNLERYGSEYPQQNKEIREKGKQTCLKKYSTKYSSQNEGIKQKFRQTCFKKYGVGNPTQNKEIKEKIKESNRKSFFTKLLNSDRLKGLVTPNFSLSNYSNVKNKYEWKCNKCNTLFLSNLDNGCIPRCPTCFPTLSSNSSHYESEIYNFLLNHQIENIIQNDRSILSPLELDIYLPDYHLAIEFNGLYWHSELNGKDKNYHLSKTLECQQKGITLIHIFEDEWVEKQEIVKSIILYKLNLTKNKIYARKCEIKQVDNQSAFKFLDENHLQGFINSKYHLGLFYDDELVSILSISRPRFNKNYNWEILRFCNKMNYSISGGFSKILSYFKSNNSGSIITYSDIRLGLDSFYEKVGFKLLNKSDPNYFYIKSGFERESRLKYQKHKLSSKLEIFDPTLTEWENMQLNNYDRIWDCGNLVYYQE